MRVGEQRRERAVLPGAITSDEEDCVRLIAGYCCVRPGRLRGSKAGSGTQESHGDGGLIVAIRPTGA